MNAVVVGFSSRSRAVSGTEQRSASAKHAIARSSTSPAIRMRRRHMTAS
jgi:hypothetical protein